jgi:HD domain
MKSSHKYLIPSFLNIVTFLRNYSLLYDFQTTKRKGWVNQGIKSPESIADHMYRMSLMALIASDLPNIDRERSVFVNILICWAKLFRQKKQTG